MVISKVLGFVSIRWIGFVSISNENGLSKVKDEFGGKIYPCFFCTSKKYGVVVDRVIGPNLSA